MARIGVRATPPRTRASAALVSGILAVVLTATLAGCVPGKSTSGAPTGSTGSTSPTAPPTPTPTITFAPKGTAADNARYFTRIGHQLLDKKPDLKGKPIVDGYVRAGFIKKNMEVTPDRTSIGLDAWNIEWSVRFGTSCLIGQAGNTRFHSFVAPVLSTGKCLFGTTRPITW